MQFAYPYASGTGDTGIVEEEDSNDEAKSYSQSYGSFARPGHACGGRLCYYRATRGLRESTVPGQRSDMAKHQPARNVAPGRLTDCYYVIPIDYSVVWHDNSVIVFRTHVMEMPFTEEESP